MYLHYAPHIKVRIFFHTDLCIRIYQRTYKWIYTPWYVWNIRAHIHICTYLRMYMTNNFANNANICTLWDVFSYDKKVHKCYKTVIIISIISNATVTASASLLYWSNYCRRALTLYARNFSFFAIHSIIFLCKYATAHTLLYSFFQ